MDQTPIAFEFPNQKTCNSKGAKTIWVRSARSGWEKRQTTLQIVLHTDGIQGCKPLMISKATGDKTGKLMDKKIHVEWKSYDQRVVVQFNKKVHANIDSMIEWIQRQFAYSSAFVFRNWETKHEPRMLLLDVFKGQLNNEVLAEFKQINCTCSFIPSGTTRFIQVCNVGINKV